MAPAYEKATGIKIEYQIQAAGGGAVPQLVSMVENKSGADLAWVQQEWLYRDALVDVSDIAEAAGKEQGGWYDEIKALSVDNGKWKSGPQANIGQCLVYRKDCIGWLDPHNNKAFLTSQISCTNNAYSIMVSAKRDLPEMGKVIDHALNPKGPNGQRYHALVPVTHGVFAYGPDPQAAKDFLRWTMDP